MLKTNDVEKKSPVDLSTKISSSSPSVTTDASSSSPVGACDVVTNRDLGDDIIILLSVKFTTRISTSESSRIVLRHSSPGDDDALKSPSISGGHFESPVIAAR